MSDNQKVEIPEKVEAVAGILRKERKYSNGVNEFPEDIYEKSLEGTNVTMDAIKEQNDHRDVFLAALALVNGETGIAEMKKDKKLEQVSAEVKMYKDYLGTTFSRSRQVPDGKGGVKTAYGVVRSSAVVNGSANKGALKKVKAHLLAEAAALA